ncbi:MAG TPA: SRPBCC family protein [Geminicoccaceae bacterium]
MRVRAVSAFIAASVVAAAPAGALEVQRSVEVAAPPDEVWAAIGEVCAIADWHPVIASCLPEEEGDSLYRVLETEDGGILREHMIEIDDAAHSYTYSILEGPLPVQGYRSTLSVTPGAEEGRSVILWQSDFTALDVPDEEAAAIIAGIYDAGLEALAARFGE